SQTAKLNAKIKWFKDLDATVNKEGILLLNIWELEALILGDVDTFNKIYNLKYSLKGDPMFIKNPKELLKELTRKSHKQYKESGCPQIFKQLNFDQVEKNCGCFREFIKEINEK